MFISFVRYSIINYEIRFVFQTLKVRCHFFFYGPPPPGTFPFRIHRKWGEGGRTTKTPQSGPDCVQYIRLYAL